MSRDLHPKPWSFRVTWSARYWSSSECLLWSSLQIVPQSPQSCSPRKTHHKGVMNGKDFRILSVHIPTSATDFNTLANTQQVAVDILLLPSARSSVAHSPRIARSGNEARVRRWRLGLPQQDWVLVGTFMLVFFNWDLAARLTPAASPVTGPHNLPIKALQVGLWKEKWPNNEALPPRSFRSWTGLASMLY